MTSKQVDNFRERHVAQVGTVHDPIKETMHVPEDHVYGIIVQPDQYGAGDLIHMRKHQQFLRGKDRERGFLAAIRQHLKKANYHNFVDLKSAFQFYDKVFIFLLFKFWSIKDDTYLNISGSICYSYLRLDILSHSLYSNMRISLPNFITGSIRKN